MKLYIDYKINDSGKGKFLQRLIPRLEDLDVSCSFTDKKADIALGIRRWRRKLSIPKVLRVDGIHMTRDKGTFYKNDLTKKSIKMSDAVIWQSRFCKDIVSGTLGVKAKKDFIIFNGDDPECYRKISRTSLDMGEADGGEKYVIMSARWKNRPWKRLKDCLRVAREVRSREDVRFLVAGKFNKNLSEPGIIFLGHLSDERLKRYLVSCNAMLNLSYYDWCPNAVVEGLTAGLPVVCNNAAGTKELIDPNTCEVVYVDPEPAAKLRVVDKPPKVDPVPVADALLRILRYDHTDTRPECPWLDIQVIAHEYVAAFRKVLG